MGLELIVDGDYRMVGLAGRCGEEDQHVRQGSICAMDESLAQQLTPWTNFKRGTSPIRQSTYFANHCPHCNTLQEDIFLHDEPEGPFFIIPQTPPENLQLVPLHGDIRLSGDCHFCI